MSGQPVPVPKTPAAARSLHPVLRSQIEASAVQVFLGGAAGLARTMPL